LVLAYIPAHALFIPGDSSPEPWKQIYDIISNMDGFAYTDSGKRFGFQPPLGTGTMALDLSRFDVAETYARWIAEGYLNDMDIDGIMFDCLWDSLFLPGYEHLDFNRDGKADDLSEIGAKWQAGTMHMLKTLHERRPKRYMIGNGRWTPYSAYMNGGEYEWFPNYNLAHTVWDRWETSTFKDPYSLKERVEHCHKPVINILHCFMYGSFNDGINDATNAVTFLNATVTSLLLDGYTYITPVTAGDPQPSYPIRPTINYTAQGTTQTIKARKANWYSTPAVFANIYIRPVTSADGLLFYAIFNPTPYYLLYQKRYLAPYNGVIVPRGSSNIIIDEA
jgi:hypothetical protein